MATKKDSREEQSQSVESRHQSEPIEDLYKKSVAGTYRKEGLTVNLQPESLPSSEHVIVLLDYNSKKHSNNYDKYVLKILESLKLDKDYLLNKKPDFKLSGYDFFQVSDYQLICIRILHSKENPNPFSQKVLYELQRKLKGVKTNQVFDTSFYFVLEENNNVSVSPLQFISELSVPNSSPLSFTIPYPKSAENRLLLDTGKEWKTITRSDNGISTNKKNEKIDFHLDDPALEDKLGRKPIAKSLASSSRLASPESTASCPVSWSCLFNPSVFPVPVNWL